MHRDSECLDSAIVISAIVIVFSTLIHVIIADSLFNYR